MNDIQIIQQKIHEIRGQRVILDYDLAELYQVTTGNLNKAVKRNIRRFPPDFMFQLTKDEFEELKANLIFHFGISRWGGTRKLPHAFTELGVAMPPPFHQLTQLPTPTVASGFRRLGRCTHKVEGNGECV